MRNKGPAFSGARGRGWKIYRGGRRKVAVRKKIEEEGRKDGRRRKKETGVVPLPFRPSADVPGIMPTELHGWRQGG